MVESYLRRARIKPHERLELDALDAIAVMVDQGLGTSPTRSPDPRKISFSVRRSLQSMDLGSANWGRTTISARPPQLQVRQSRGGAGRHATAAGIKINCNLPHDSPRIQAMVANASKAIDPHFGVFSKFFEEASRHFLFGLQLNLNRRTLRCRRRSWHEIDCR